MKLEKGLTYIIQNKINHDQLLATYKGNGLFTMLNKTFTTNEFDVIMLMSNE